MKKATLVLAGAFFCVIFFIGLAQAADKFGYVDIFRIASEYNKAKDYNKNLEDKAKIYDAEVDKKVNEIKVIQDKINLLSEKEKETKNSELEGKVKILQEFRREKETELRKKDFENSKEIAEDIRKVIKQHAEKEGYTFIFDERALLYHTNAFNITDKVIEILNSGYKK